MNVRRLTPVDARSLVLQLRLDVDATNEPAKQLYLRHGDHFVDEDMMVLRLDT